MFFGSKTTASERPFREGMVELENAFANQAHDHHSCIVIDSG